MPLSSVLALIGFAASLRSFEARHVRASIAIVIALLGFGVVLNDTSIKIGRLEGPRLRQLELSSTPWTPGDQN